MGITFTSIWRGSALKKGGPYPDKTVRDAYKMGQKTREMVAEAQEHVHDIVAEVDAEGDKKAATTKSSARSSMPAA